MPMIAGARSHLYQGSGASTTLAGSRASASHVRRPTTVATDATTRNAARREETAISPIYLLTSPEGRQAPAPVGLANEHMPRWSANELDAEFEGRSGARYYRRGQRRHADRSPLVTKL